MSFDVMLSHRTWQNSLSIFGAETNAKSIDWMIKIWRRKNCRCLTIRRLWLILLLSFTLIKTFDAVNHQISTNLSQMIVKFWHEHVRRNSSSSRSQYIANIKLLRLNSHDRHASFRIAISDSMNYWRSTTILWQQASVNVQHSSTRR